MWRENGELHSIFRAHQRRTHINRPSFVANNPDPLAAIWPNISPCSYFLCPFVLRIMNMAHCEKNEGKNRKVCQLHHWNCPIFVTLRESYLPFLLILWCKLLSGPAGSFFFLMQILFFNDWIGYVPFSAGYCDTIFFFKVPLKKTSPSPIYFFQCSFKILM